eukprot:12537399-Heterocapsa_arctica.AAC.1
MTARVIGGSPLACHRTFAPVLPYACGRKVGGVKHLPHVTTNLMGASHMQQSGSRFGGWALRAC